MPIAARRWAPVPLMSRPLNDDATARQPVRPGDRAQHRRLAGAVRPDERDRLARLDGEIDPAHRLQLAVARLELLDRKQRQTAPPPR